MPPVEKPRVCMCHYGGDPLWGGLQSPNRAPGQPPGAWVQGRDQGRGVGAEAGLGVHGLDPCRSCAPTFQQLPPPLSGSFKDSTVS